MQTHMDISVGWPFLFLEAKLVQGRGAFCYPQNRHSPGSEKADFPYPMPCQCATHLPARTATIGERGNQKQWLIYYFGLSAETATVCLRPSHFLQSPLTLSSYQWTCCSPPIVTNAPRQDCSLGLLGHVDLLIYFIGYCSSVIQGLCLLQCVAQLWAHCGI